MCLRLCLIRNGDVICDLPLTPKEWRRDDLERECLKLKEKLDDISKVFRVFTNENRLQMLLKLVKEEDFILSFNDFMKSLELNPKTIREHTAKLFQAGFIEMPKRGKYRLSELGKKRFIAIGLVLRQILEIIDEE